MVCLCLFEGRWLLQIDLRSGRTRTKTRTRTRTRTMDIQEERRRLLDAEGTDVYETATGVRSEEDIYLE